jgi:hypothetical protein
MRLRAWLMMLAAATLLVPGLTQGVYAQRRGRGRAKTQSFVLKPNKSTERGSDPNIKDEGMTNSQNQEMPGPANKGAGGGTRGQSGVCRVNVDNWTPWKVQIYVDSSFRGMVSPWGDGVTYTGAGPTRVYARAEFDNGSVLTWGPRDYECYSGQYIYFRLDK